jgi:hypothetical protein
MISLSPPRRRLVADDGGSLRTREQNGTGGVRTLAVQIKSLLCFRYTTAPREGRGPFESISLGHDTLLRKTQSRSRWSRTTALALSERGAPVTPPSVVERRCEPVA